MTVESLNDSLDKVGLTSLEKDTVYIVSKSFLAEFKQYFLKDVTSKDRATLLLMVLTEAFSIALKDQTGDKMVLDIAAVQAELNKYTVTGEVKNQVLAFITMFTYSIINSAAIVKVFKDRFLPLRAMVIVLRHTYKGM